VRIHKGKPETVEAIRDRLLALADDQIIAPAMVEALQADDVSACAGLPDETLRAYLHALQRSATMDAGQVPPDYTQPLHCDGCGPVWLWPGAPATLKGCPWCFRRKAGRSFARPLVTCGDCRHYMPDPHNAATGVGRCALGDGRTYWSRRHACAEHRVSVDIARMRAHAKDLGRADAE